jgi:membrane-associated phospholipid phosphatase
VTAQHTDRHVDAARRPGPRPAGGPRRSRHGPVAQLLIAWSPLSFILAAYAAAQWINAPRAQRDGGGGANRLGFGLHVAGPARVDEAVFGVLPSIWLQQRLVDGSTHWYDAVAALVYVTHFVSIPLVTGLAWFRMRDRFAAWLAAVLAFTLVGMAGYVLYPAAPPWLASQLGAVGSVERLSRFGWHYLDLGEIARAGGIGQADSNPVAAMPSLHAGAALLVAAFLWPVVGGLWRAVLVAYVALMALALVYTGEHYVIDVVAGWFTAAVAVTVGALVQRRAS